MLYVTEWGVFQAGNGKKFMFTVETVTNNSTVSININIIYQVGNGVRVGSNRFIHWKDTTNNPFDVMAVTIFGGAGENIAYWQFNTIEGIQFLK